MIEFLASLSLLVGSFFLAAAAVGVWRLPDPCCRCHALSVAMTAGFCGFLIALWLLLGSTHAGVKICLTIVFQCATTPVASHLLLRLALVKKERSQEIKID